MSADTVPSTDLPPDVAIETIYVVEVDYTPEAADRRPPVRAEHLAHIARLRDAGTIVEAGGHADLSTALLLVRARSADDAVALFADDVYVRAGVWGDIRAKAYGRVVRPAELKERE
ncbi:MAG TPA: YciI family protein [Candidatus Acidoferrum sp.]|nr:YciI family protein [Candidatus Acidoferrum sp.]